MSAQYIKHGKNAQVDDVVFLTDKRPDKKGKLKERPWRAHKRISSLLSESYGRIGEYGKAYYCADCGSRLDFKIFSDGSKTLHNASFCRVRLCPMCAWRRSLKIFGQVSKVMDYLSEDCNYKYIFLTFTVKNVGDDLSKSIDALMLAWKQLGKRKEFRKVSQGSFRALEVKKRIERTDYHPHIHAIVMVNKSYFTENSVYLSHAEWQSLWRQCANLDYDPQVDVRVVKPDEKKGDDTIAQSDATQKVATYSEAVAEVAKYAVKGSEFILDARQMAKDVGLSIESNGYKQLEKFCRAYTDEVVTVLDSALKGRRLVSFGGKMREVHKLLNLDDPEDGDLINTDNEDIRDDLGYVIETYRWHIGYMNYVLE